MFKVSIIGGSAFSPRLEELSKDFLACHPNAILIVPTQRYASWWERKLLCDLNITSLTGKYVYDFTNFVRALLEKENISCNLIEVWKQELIVKSILLSEEGKLILNQYQLQSPENLASHIVEIIRNLKQGGIEPDEFFYSIPSEKRGLREEVIHWVYRRYQEIMYQNSWYDVPGMFWTAEEVCKNKKPGLLSNVNAIFLEGFDDFTYSEMRLLKSFDGRVESLRIYLNYDPSPEKQDLYKLSYRALKNLEKIFSTEVRCLDSFTSENRIQFVAQNLYWRELPKRCSFDKGEIKIRFYSNRDTEIRETAREIKKLIIEKNISPFSIALIFRKLESVQKIIERVFEEFGIPYEIGFRRKFEDTIIGRFLWNWFTHLLDDKVFSILQIFHDPLWKLPPEVKIKISLILRSFGINLNHPIDVLEERLQKLPLDKEMLLGEEEDEEHIEETENIKKEDVDKFKVELEKWLNWRKIFTSTQSAKEFVEVTEQFVKEIWSYFSSGEIVLDKEKYGENKEGVGAFLKEIKVIPKFFADSNLGLETLIEIVLDMLRGIVVGTKINRGVFIGELPTIRNLKFDYVFLCGVERGNIPLHRGINALYSEKEITEISNAYKIPVETLEDHLHRERLLFQKVFESAIQGVHLSFALFSEVNAEIAPSLLISDVLELCEIMQYDCGYTEGIFTSPEFELPCSDRELKLVKFLKSPHKQLQDEYPSEATRAQTYQIRLKNEEGEYFGIIKAEDLLNYLSNQFDNKHVYSSNQIETYIDCPFLFFANRILSLTDWERDTDEPPPALVGSWAHRVLQYLLSDYLDKVSKREDISNIVSEVVDRVIDNDFKIKFFPSGIIQVFKNRLKILIEAMVYDGLVTEKWHPKYFEISFGETKDEEGEKYPKLPPFSWDIEGEKILFSGRIDRVDINTTNDKKVAKIIDYKWRKAPSQLASRRKDFDIDEIISIQLTLYGLALEKHILSDEEIKTSEGCFFIVYPEGNRRSREIKAKWNGKPESIQKWREMTGKRILNVIKKIRSGYFSPEPRSKNMCEHCQWLNSCKYKRSLHKEEVEEFSEDAGSVE